MSETCNCPSCVSASRSRSGKAGYEGKFKLPERPFAPSLGPRPMGILEIVGEKCARLLDARVRYVKAAFVQTDEIHAFCRLQGTAHNP